MNNSFWQAKVSKPIVEIMLRKLDGIVSQCAAMKEDLTIFWHISSDKIRVIYNPVALEVEKNISVYNRKEKENEILFVGRFSPEKGISILINSFNELLPRFPLLKLRLLGEGELETSLREQCNRLNISDKVIFQGFVSDPIPFYQKALVTALPSFSEGFPNVLIESISLGTPVVAFDCETGPAEIIKDGVNGYLVELGNQRKFTEALETTLTQAWNFKVEDYRQDPIISKYLDFLRMDIDP
jgi:glycosyltransferase involved in cell wall biosynthesis